MSFLLTGGLRSVDSLDCNLEECWSDLALGNRDTSYGTREVLD